MKLHSATSRFTRQLAANDSCIRIGPEMRSSRPLQTATTRSYLHGGGSRPLHPVADAPILQVVLDALPARVSATHELGRTDPLL